MILCKEEHAKKINSAVFPGQQGGPLMHVVAGKAVALKIAQSEVFRERQRRTRAGAAAVAEELLGAGVNVLTGGTDVHLALVDLRESELDGQQAEDRLDDVGITVNRNAVPFDPRPPAVSSGLRVGTPALATRGFDVDDFREVGRVIAEALTADAWTDEVRVRAVRADARARRRAIRSTGRRRRRRRLSEEPLFELRGVAAERGGRLVLQRRSIRDRRRRDRARRARPGPGKSTLLRLLNRLADPVSGRVSLRRPRRARARRPRPAPPRRARAAAARAAARHGGGERRLRAVARRRERRRRLAAWSWRASTRPTPPREAARLSVGRAAARHAGAGARARAARRCCSTSRPPRSTRRPATASS